MALISLLKDDETIREGEKRGMVAESDFDTS